MSYTDEELIELYKEAKDKNKQIGILADLKCCDVKEILEMLQENGLISGVKKKSEKGKWTPEGSGAGERAASETPPSDAGKVAETFDKLRNLQKKCLRLINAYEDAETYINSIADLARLGMEAMEVTEDPAGTMFEILNFIVMKCNDFKVMIKKEEPPLDCGNPSGGKMI